MVGVALGREVWGVGVKQIVLDVRRMLCRRDSGVGSSVVPAAAGVREWLEGCVAESEWGYPGHSSGLSGEGDRFVW